MKSQSQPEPSDPQSTPRRYPRRKTKSSKVNYDECQLQIPDQGQKRSKQHSDSSLSPAPLKDHKKDSETKTTGKKLFHRTILSNQQTYHQLRKGSESPRILSNQPTSKITIQSFNSLMNVGGYSFNTEDPTVKISEYNFLQNQNKETVCKCTKSHCVKEYCACFKAGNFCDPLKCSCSSLCENIEQELSDRMRKRLNPTEKSQRGSIKQSSQKEEQLLQSIKSEFEAIQKGTDETKGLIKKTSNNFDAVDVKKFEAFLSSKEACHCKKNKCLKNYCPCRKSDSMCGQKCECSDCENVEKRKN